MQLLELIDAAEAARYAHLTYPSFRPVLGSPGTPSPVVAIAASLLGKPAGLALAELQPETTGWATVR
ncbi:MAG TPA: GNAT family N-acetyltransferase, partial [Chloroflexota bacterium]|nr:GNAT family N-acetyltransferase [Chloroflexota bacterium]